MADKTVDRDFADFADENSAHRFLHCHYPRHPPSAVKIFAKRSDSDMLQQKRTFWLLELVRG
jgi:hypothetical protein